MIINIRLILLYRRSIFYDSVVMMAAILKGKKIRTAVNLWLFWVCWPALCEVSLNSVCQFSPEKRTKARPQTLSTVIQKDRNCITGRRSPPKLWVGGTKWANHNEVGRAKGQTIRKCRVKGLVSSSNVFFYQSIVACKHSSVRIVLWMRQLGLHDSFPRSLS